MSDTQDRLTMTQGQHNPSHRKPMLIMLAAVGVLVVGVVGFNQFKAKMIAQAIKGQTAPPQSVATVVAVNSTWQAQLQALGTLRASQQSVLSTEAGGLVSAIHFSSGQRVKAGQLLIELSPAPQAAALQQAQAQAALAAITLKRDQAQLKIQAVSQAQVDTDAATLQADQALVAAQQALLEQKRIKAPFAGVLGIRQIDPGQFLAAGSAIVTLQQLDPMDIDFTLPQSQSAMVHVGQKVTLASSAQAGHDFTATVSALEPQIDSGTRSLKVRARVANAKGLLLPGAFASVELEQGQPQNYLTLPNAAIAFNPYGATVFVVKNAGQGADGKPKLVAEQRFVTVGPTRGDQVAVLSGVKAGEVVVSAGQLKLRNGSPVVVNNSVQPSNEAHPQQLQDN